MRTRPQPEAALRYFLDTEFNGFGGQLISLALVGEDGEGLYLIYPPPAAPVPWVERIVLPRLLSVPNNVTPRHVDQPEGAWAIGELLQNDPDPSVIADWPDDIRLFCQALMPRPQTTVPLDRLRLDIRRVEPYPTDLEGAVEHNAWWDALALRRRILRHETDAVQRG